MCIRDRIIGIEDPTPSPNRGSQKIDYGIVRSDHVVKSSRESSIELD